METGKFTKLQGKTFRYLVICSVGLLCFVALGIYPRQKSINDLNAKIGKLETEIAAQKILLPVFNALVKRGKIKNPEGLSLPKKAKLDRAKAVMVSNTFRGLARMSGLQVIEIKPDLKTLAKESKNLSVSLHLSGDFSNFHGFLIRVEEIPYLEHLERIQIQPVVGFREFRLKLWLALERV